MTPVRFAILLCCGLVPHAGFSEPIVVNPLSADQTRTFFHLSEGGAVMPLFWYRTLEVVDSTTGQATGQTFSQRMANYGFLEDSQSNLPVGFGTTSLDFLGGLEGLSINCAACHVGELHYGAAQLRVIGGPNLADVRRFAQDVYASSTATLGAPGKLLRFLARSNRLQPETVALLKDMAFVESGEFDCIPASPAAEEFTAAVKGMAQQRPSPASTSKTAAASSSTNPSTAAALSDVYRNLQLIVAELQYFLAQGRFPLTTREGFGRLDAFATVRFLLFPEQSADFPFTAPISVPYLWGLKQKQWLHWNNNTNSTMQRNIAQSLGMGALQAPGGINNVLVPNLASLESIAENLVPPQWPAAVLGPLDAMLVQRGEALYNQRCASCHDAGKVDPASGLTEYPLFSLSQTGTDPNHAMNFHRPVGQKSFPAALEERMRELQSWYYDLRDPTQRVPLATRIAWGGGNARLPATWRDPLATDVNAPVYAALPLTGVWSTAPYLHNNSVPTLRDLLKPAAQRPSVFMVGQRDYDPVNVGYAQPADPTSIPDLNRFDITETGNANTGHEGSAFGSDGLSSDEIDALLEYLKSL